jgi:citrate synthase
MDELNALRASLKGTVSGIMFAREGLEGVVAARTSICLIKGEEGKLAYRGYSIDDLAEKADFEETAYLLWFGDLPAPKRLAWFSAELKANRKPPEPGLEAIGSLLRTAHPMDALRTAVSMLALSDPDVGDNREEANLRKSIRLTAAMPTLAALHSRMRRGLEPIAPDEELDHAENFLYMATGKRPSPIEATAMRAAMTLQADHGLNASSFAARVTAGTLSDMHAALTSAIGAFKGPLDGGAVRGVMEMLIAIGDKRKAKGAIDKMLKAKKRIPGFGHRIYKGVDPRAVHFRRICERIGNAAPGNARWFELTTYIEELVRKRTGLGANVDFYAAPAYYMLGFGFDDFAPVFACSRAAGWIAHVIEQYSDNRLIRPLEEYIGPLPRPFIPLHERI